MKRILILTLFIMFYTLKINAQSRNDTEDFFEGHTEWTQWQQYYCYTGLFYRLRHKIEINPLSQKYSWVIQFKSTYSKTVYFEYAYASSTDGELYKHGIKDVIIFGRTNVEANDKSYPVSKGLLTNSNVQVIIKNINFSNDSKYVDCYGNPMVEQK